MSVFAFVLGKLPDRVKVYPTENYYYFTFFHGHIRYAGNFRLDVTNRDEGKIHFAYFEDLQEWVPDEDAITHEILDAAKGVSVEKLAPLVYRVSHGGKSVVFELNDLSNVKPPPGAFGPDEVYLGPIFDESAMRFFLVFNRKLKLFHYVLDETVEVADQFITARETDRILIGKRTGFAYYRDHRLNRKILIGVHGANSRVNNYFDGPFDQLPDNFIEGEALREAILAVDPKLAGRIDRYGIFDGGRQPLHDRTLPAAIVARMSCWCSTPARPTRRCRRRATTRASSTTTISASCRPRCAAAPTIRAASRGRLVQPAWRGQRRAGAFRASLTLHAPHHHRNVEAVGVGAPRGHQQPLLRDQHGAAEQVGTLAERVRHLCRRRARRSPAAARGNRAPDRRSPRQAPSR